MSLPPGARRKMTAKMLLFTVFCCVSGGPYGLEALIGQSGAGLGLLLILVIPLLWAVPDAFVTAELASAMPVEGGYYQWVKKALGPNAAFLNGWWTWLYGMVDASLYPVYFAATTSEILKVAFGSEALEGSPFLKWGVGFLVIVGFTILNLLGTRAVGKASTLLAICIIAPFLVLGAVAAFRYAGDPRPLSLAFLPEGGSLTTALAGGLGIAMWNYLGWDSLSTIAEEVEEPQKAYPLALVWGVPLVTAVYVIAVLAGLPFFPAASEWQEGVWPTIAQAVGGAPLFWLISLGAALSSMALFTATFLGASRLPFVMAQDRWLPGWLVTLHPKWGTPAASIILCAAIYSVLSALFSWQELIAINVVLYATALVMEGISLVIFRIRQPDMPRPFRIPGGLGVAVMFCVVPTAMIVTLIVVSIMEGGWMQVVPTAVALASGPVVLAAILLVRRLKGSSAGGSGIKG